MGSCPGGSASRTVTSTSKTAGSSLHRIAACPSSVRLVSRSSGAKTVQLQTRPRSLFAHYDYDLRCDGKLTDTGTTRAADFRTVCTDTFARTPRAVRINPTSKLAAAQGKNLTETLTNWASTQAKVAHHSPLVCDQHPRALPDTTHLPTRTPQATPPGAVNEHSLADSDVTHTVTFSSLSRWRACARALALQRVSTGRAAARADQRRDD